MTTPANPATPATVTLDDIRQAHDRIRSGIYRSPCPPSIPLSDLTGCTIWCKLDLLQRTGSFKERGARNALLLLDPAQRARGVVAASAGNHALGLAYHGKLLGIPVTVVMPRFAPIVKVATCRKLGARVILEGDSFDDARRLAVEMAGRDGLNLVHGFDDARVIAGQGTMALEILEDVPDAEVIVVPTGGAGLLAGVATVAKSLDGKLSLKMKKFCAMAALSSFVTDAFGGRDDGRLQAAQETSSSKTVRADGAGVAGLALAEGVAPHWGRRGLRCFGAQDRHDCVRARVLCFLEHQGLRGGREASVESGHGGQGRELGEAGPRTRAD